MTKNKKLLIGLVVLAFCVCCAIFGFGFASKNRIVANADTISETTIATATATTVKSISLNTNTTEEAQTITVDPIAEETEEIQYILEDGHIETDESEEEIFEDDSPDEYENYVVPPFWQDTTFSGDVSWTDDDNKMHPLRQIKLQIGDYITYTDNRGRFNLTQMFVIGSSIDIVAYAVDCSQDYEENIRIKDDKGNLYSHVLISGYEILSSENTFRFIISMHMINVAQPRAGQAFQILQAMITARDFAKEMMGKMPSPVTVYYPVSDHAYYYSESKKIEISYAEPYIGYPYTYASWDLLMHEYGHHIQYEMGITDSPGGKHNSSESDADALGDKDKGIRLAWGESWPTVFGMIAQKYYVEKGILSNIKTVGDSYYTAYTANNAINYDINTEAERKGEACEQSIMGVLWDLFDDDVEENDTIALGYKGFWDVTTKKGSKTFADFMDVFYDMYSELIYELGANLSYYKMASYDLTVDYITLQTFLPKFSWQRGGSSKYPNINFAFSIYDANDKEIFRPSHLLPSPSYTLSLAEWDKILNADGNYFYFTVCASNYYDGIATSYFSSKIKVEKPYNEISENINVFTLGLNRHLQVTSGENEWLFKFVAPTSGTYIFYTEGGSDTYGEVYSYLYEYQYNVLAYDDNSGDSANFQITLNLNQNQCVYIRVKAKTFWLYYNMCVKQE